MQLGNHLYNTMEKIYAMTIRKLIATSLLAMLTLGTVMLAPLSSADSFLDFDIGTTDSDSAQGDVTSDQCASLDESMAAAMGCDTSDKVIDFTEYSGELEGPDAAGYDDALTQNKSAREFIQTIVNFALSFLGLVATVVIIYGGVMYVASRGDEEMASKGKKTISYAAVGILIILGSFAIVNTLISAGGGGVNDGLGTGSGGTTITDAGAAFDVDGVLHELTDVMTDYIDTYDSYLYVTQEVAYMGSIEMPLIVDVEVKDGTLGGAIDALGEAIAGTDNDYADQYELIDENDIDEYIDDLRESIGDIQTQVDSLSDTYESAQTLYDYLRSGGTFSGLLEMLANIAAPQVNAAESEPRDENTLAGLGCSERVYSENTYRDIGLGATVYDTEVSQLDDNICGLIADIQTAANSDYEEQVGDLLDRLTLLSALFDTDGSSVGSSLTAIKDAFEAAISELTTASTSINANTVRDLVEAINDAYTLVQNIQFVAVQMTASATEGNAPLIVRFDILGTEDPSGETVEDEQIEWDLYGDGSWTSLDVNIGPNASQINGFLGDATSTLYEEAGTYRARVRVLSQDPNIAAGIATISIEVGAPQSILVLTAEAGGEPTYLADNRSFPAIDQDAYKVTMTEAEEGISFDASESTDGDGNANGIIFAEWDFGDNEIVSGSWDTYSAPPPHKYGEEGAYDISLTITDQTGVEDRKYFKLYVASPAARLTAFPESGIVGTIFKFDGTGSSTDIGTIISYQWSASLNGETYDLNNTSGNSISESFTRPGIYTVTLTVTDSSDVSDSTSVEVLVESEAPEAIFETEIPNSNQPAIVEFDATESFDPDEGDTITYEWDFDGYEGDDYEILEGSTSEAEVTIKYLAIDEYKAELKVCDQHEEKLQKCDETSGIIDITSLLDVDLEIEGENARHLNEDGESMVEFYAYSEHATGFEIDYGDGETDFTEIITRDQSTFTHTYESAGVFYATLTAYDEESKMNSITRRVYIAPGDSPIAVIDVTADGEDIGFGDSLTGTVNTLFSFNAGNSVNVDGSMNTLNYSWNFGDGTTASQSNVTHKFEEHATYTVTLTAKDKEEPAISDETTLQITIQGLDPEIRGITVTPQAATLETPLKVNVEVDAVDNDGEINYVKGWYYDLEDSAEELGTVIAQTLSFTLTVNTKGEQGDKVEYGFAVEVTDDGNNTVSSFDELSTDEIPILEVTNGPNDSPVAAFNVDRTSVYIGEEVTFSSTSYDPDGEIIAYWWDIEGDGFYNNEQQEADSYTYEYIQAHMDGVDVQLKVEDDTGATAFSDPVTIYVDAITDPPEARFLTNVDGTTVEFVNNSDIDEENGAQLQGIYWDFDLATDSDGNGGTDDDFDSFEEEDSYTYPEMGTYEVKMTVSDNTGQIDTVTQEITVTDSSDPYASFSFDIDLKTVEFENRSTVDDANGAEVREYIWDFDAEIDSDGDGDPANDVDSSEENPSYTYEEYGDYEVMLTVTDTYGGTDSRTRTVEVDDPLAGVEALLTSVPTPNDLGQILVVDDPSEITLYYSADGGNGDYSFTIDKNIFYDTDGDGIRDNDVDYEAETSGVWAADFYQSWGQIVIKLTATDEDTGDTDVATLQVVFEGSLGGANLFNATPSEMAILILSAMLTAIFGVSLAFTGNRAKS
jgi:PKD repeat protein